MALFNQLLKGQEGSHESPPIASPMAGRFAYSDEFINEIGAWPTLLGITCRADIHLRRASPGARMARTQRWGLHIAVGAARWIRVRCGVRCCREEDVPC